MHIRGMSNRKIIEAQLRNISSRYPFTDEHIETIFTHYQEAWREYHNLEHIVELFQLLSQCDLKSFTEDEKVEIGRAHV